jgi:hypothetical protein
LQEHIPVEEVLQNLECRVDGLTSKDGEARIAIFGPNKLEEKKVRFNLVGFLEFTRFLDEGVFACL